MVESNYCRSGAGTPLVLLHSLGQRWQVWLPVLDRLSEHHDVIAVDLPRFGRSPHPGAVTEEGIREFGVRSLELLFDHLGVRRPHVAGLGLGGMLAAVASTTGMVASATALSPTGFWTPAQRAWLIAHLRLFRLAARVSLAVDPSLASSGWVRSAVMSRLSHEPGRIGPVETREHLAAMREAPPFDEAMRATRRFHWRGGRTPSVPLTLAWAERDRMISPKQAVRAAGLLPDARAVRLPGCGHLSMADDPVLVARTILTTCARADHRGAVLD